MIEIDERSKKFMPRKAQRKDYDMPLANLGLESGAVRRILNNFKGDVKALLMEAVDAFEAHPNGDIGVMADQWAVMFNENIASYYYRQMFSLGFTGKANDELPKELDAFITKAAAEETAYFRDAVKRILERLRDDKDASIDMIVTSYTDSLEAQFYNGYVAALPPDARIIDWQLDPDKAVDHCPDCLDIASAGPYSRKTLPTVPRAGDTQCMWRCKCKLVIKTEEL